MGPLNVVNTTGVKTIGVLIRGDNTSLRTALQQSRSEIQSFARTANDSMRGAAGGIRGASDTITNSSRQASTALRGTASAAEQMGAAATGSFTNLSGLIARFAGPLGLGAIVTQIARVGIGFHDFSQRATIALTTMLGSGEKAKEFLGDILAFAKQTPFAFPELTAAAQKLLAFGLGAEQVIPTLRALGDAAAATGSGVAMVERLAGVVGQIQAKGRLQGDEILQLAEAGVPALRILANQAGKTAAAFSKDVTAGLVDADTAIRGLVDGLENGTTGLNGTTVAFGGMMEQIKGSGGWTSTMDAATSGFRNMSAALTESLMPSLTSLIRLGTTVGGVVANLAGIFNGLPKPVRDAATALTVLAVAQRLLDTNLTTSARGGLTTFRTGLSQAALGTRLAALRVGELKLAFSGVGASARSAKDALVGAFGGPVGIAIAVATTAIVAWSGANAEANARTQALADTLDAQTGALTANSTAWIANEVTREQAFGINNASSMAEIAEQMGVSVETLTKAYEGNAAAAAEAKTAADRWQDAQGFDPLLINASVAEGFKRNIDEQATKLDHARQITDAKRRVDAAATDQVSAMSSAYGVAAVAVTGFTEEQIKAGDAAADAARRAFDAAVSLTKLDLNTSSAEDLADAQDKVTDATRRLRDAEQARQDLAGKEEVTAADRIRAEESVADARKALDETTAALTETESRSDPVANYRRQVSEMLEAAQNFSTNIQALADQGLNGKTLSELIALGPQGSKEAIDALMSDSSLIGFTNSYETEMGKVGDVTAIQARVAQTGMTEAGKLLGGDLGLAMRIAVQEGSADTVQAIADKLGEDPDKIRAVGRTFGLTFMEGVASALDAPSTMRVFADGSFSTGAGAPRGMAAGGIYPGYTPGRDIGFIGISGGEAVMRPEWTLAMGSDYVNLMNRLALQGPSAIRQAHSRYMGGFASGGIAGAYTSSAPTVVTVPVSSTHERYSPQTFVGAIFTDPDAAARFGDRARAQSNVFGG